MKNKIIFIFLICSILNSVLYAQQSLKIEKYHQDMSIVNDIVNSFRLLKASNSGFKPLGPLVGGSRLQHIYAFDVSKSNPDIIFASIGRGGIYKSTNAGAHWTKTASFNATSIAIDDSDPKIVYATQPG